MGISTELGRAHEVDLPGGRIRYHDTGEGPPIVFVHGLLVNADLWRKVVPSVAAAGYRCLTPDWPLGAHRIAVPDLELTPVGVADLIASFLERLDLTDVTVVANDTGGAITQVLMTRKPARIGRVVLAAVDSYESFLPRPFTLLSWLARIPGSMRPLIESARIRALHSTPLVFGLVAKRPVPPEIADSYLAGPMKSGAVRKDLRLFLKNAHRRYTLAAATHFAAVDFPVLVVWAREDKVFPMSYAERLVRDLPHATLKVIDDSYTFLPEDQPELLTESILEFTRLHATP
ncbi:pimeloyl-ACP methyl ester carboxylesterase [Nocardia tenerifensis]|uniref:Pimeloyl-ACP methyl ester carboxylesterase n=1 Tax=Nocardia tenerifensis TaxID=228006 RepID=A0A318JZY0_9NOCA|nr:alpha/beta hydrolase [Nocardia tenerifensis]PXX60306.1 pimeloyl-ACP methyl ester carboxylesterase [Nocardia tenerifensis]